MRVRELLVQKKSPPVTCWPVTKVTKIARVMEEEDIGLLPVVDESRALVGVVSERDIARAVGRLESAVSELKARDIMTTDVVTCRPEDPVKGTMELMDRRHIRHLPVIEGARELVGVLSIRDVLSGLLDSYREEAATLREQDMLDRLRRGDASEE